MLPTAPPADGGDVNAIGPLAAAAAAAELDHIKPQPWPADWQQANAALKKLDRSTVADSVWIASGLGNVDAKMFYATLQNMTASQVLRVLGTASPIYMADAAAKRRRSAYRLPVQRAVTDDAADCHNRCRCARWQCAGAAAGEFQRRSAARG